MQDFLLLASWSDGRKPQRFALFGQSINIGHDPYCDIVMPPQFTPHADYHASITLRNQLCFIEDPLQVHAIYLNGRRLDGQAILSVEATAYIGNPLRDPLYLRLQVEVSQHTQMVQAQEDLGMTALARSIGPIPPSLPEHISPYLMMSWSKEAYSVQDLDQDALIVGRSALANVALPNHLTFVSALHFQIIRADDHFFVQDKASTNGTHLNRTLLEPHRLYRLVDGDIINIRTPGQLIWFIFHDPMSPRPSNLARQADPDPPSPSISKPLAAHPAPAAPKAATLWERIVRFLTS
jgi:hypothetical protein